MMPKRIQLSRRKGWRMPANTVVVARPTRWGNPFNFRASDYCWIALSLDCRGDAAGRQEASVKAFRLWLQPPNGRRLKEWEFGVSMEGPGGTAQLGPRAKAGVAPSTAEIREALRGKNLACWCKPGTPCHADVLLEIANPMTTPTPGNRKGRR